MEEKKIVAFSLLAHINDNSVGIRNFDDIFTPLVKSSLCHLNRDGVKSGGSLNEIKIKLDKLYGLDIPLPYLKSLLERISEESEKYNNLDFKLHNDGSFLLGKFIFTEFEDQIDESEGELKEIAKLYNTYLESEGLNPKKEPSLFEYLDKSRLRLSKFFAHGTTKMLELTDVHQANFINSLRSQPKLFNALRKVYLGSIISAYLSVDIGKVEKDLELLLDTNFIVGLLDLNSIESTHTCRKIIAIAKKMGIKVSVLAFTIQETELLIERKAREINESFFQGYLDPESIFSAVLRRNLSPTQLTQIISNLEKELNEEYGISVLKNDQKFRNLAKFQHKEVLSMYEKSRGKHGFSALHDTTAVAYVREKRNNKVVTGNFMNGLCYFVTNTPYGALSPKTNGISEIIRAGELLSLFWLSGPQAQSIIDGSELSNLGLTRLVSTTVSNSLPNSRTLKELDENFGKFSGNGQITADDTLVVANLIAKKKIDSPEYLVKLAKKDGGKFIKEVKSLAEKGREEEQNLHQKVNQLLEKFEESFNKKEELKVEPSSTSKSSEYIIAGLSLALISFILWTFDIILDLNLKSNINNYSLVRILVQVLLISSGIAIVTKNKSFWLGGLISLIIAIVLLMKGPR